MRKRKYLLCLVLLASVALLNMPAPTAMRIKATSRDNLAPFQNVMSLLILKIHERVSAVRRQGGDAGRRRELESEVVELRQRIRQMETLSGENAELRELLGFMRRGRHRLIMCEVVGRGGAGGWWETVTLSSGRDRGIRPNMAVVTGDGLIGRTIEVTRHTSAVLLITDPNSKVSCEFARVGAFGIVRGRGVDTAGESVLEMLCAMPDVGADYVARDHKVVRGDEVVTSGLGGVYPKGLAIGRVAESRVDVSRLYQVVDVVPSADMRRLRFVFVVDPRSEDDWRTGTDAGIGVGGAEEPGDQDGGREPDATPPDAALTDLNDRQ